MSALVKRNGHSLEPYFHERELPVLRVVPDAQPNNPPSTYYVDRHGVEHFNMRPFIAQINAA